ncbi:hypothetical protein NDU88_012605 [Pleurodeles waltl]|uniref:Uncharacterized protein n=1 Tax=Pleurodeles waltl TaxID=8319 RepID=A0AAV7R6F4_PLEWA|nr:hypothetical protein NDU88_012605 [Pleurodeles waltl]
MQSSRCLSSLEPAGLPIGMVLSDESQRVIAIGYPLYAQPTHYMLGFDLQCPGGMGADHNQIDATEEELVADA